MRELAKVLCVVVLLFAAPAAAAWGGGIGDAPGRVTPALKYAGPPLCVIAIAAFLALHFRRDEAPDYLAARVGPWLPPRAGIEPVAVGIECGPAAFGVARVPRGLLGRRQRFEVGASVEFPDGRGRRVRFRGGAALRANSRFGNAFVSTLTVAGALAGHVVYTSPSVVEVGLPNEAVEDTAELGIGVAVETLWRLGDPPLTARGPMN